MRIAIPALAQQHKARRRGLGAVFLAYNHRIWRQPATRLQQRRQAIGQPLAIGGIHENQINRVHRGRQFIGRAGQHGGIGLPPGLGQVFGDQTLRHAAIIHECRMHRPARKRLEAQRAGSGKQIQHPRPLGQAMALQDAKQRLAHAVGGGAQMRTLIPPAHAGQGKAAVLACDDPHAFISAFRSLAGSATTSIGTVLPASIRRLPII